MSADVATSSSLPEVPAPDSDDELEAALTAAMEDEALQPQERSGTDSDDELEAALTAAMEEDEPPSTMSDAELARELQAEEYSRDAPRLAQSAGSSIAGPSERRRALVSAGTCWLLLLPEELLRRVLRFVSIANLLGHVRLTSKYFASVAIMEVRERVRGQLHDALVAGFESEAAARSSAASTTGGDGAGAGCSGGLIAAATAAAAAGDCTLRGKAIVSRVIVDRGGGSSSRNIFATAGTSIGAGNAQVCGAPNAEASATGRPAAADPSPAPAAVGRVPLPPSQRRRLVALAEALEAELTKHAASCGRDATRTLTSKCRSISFNLSDTKNPELRSRLLAGDLLPSSLVRMSSQEMASSALRAQRDEWHAKWLKKAVRYARDAHSADAVPHTRCRCRVHDACIRTTHERGSHSRLLVAGRNAPSATKRTCIDATAATRGRRACTARSALDNVRSTARGRTSLANLASTAGKKAASDQKVKRAKCNIIGATEVRVARRVPVLGVA